MGSRDPCQRVARKSDVGERGLDHRAWADCLQALELVDDVAEEPGHALESVREATITRPSVERAGECVSPSIPERLGRGCRPCRPEHRVGQAVGFHTVPRDGVLGHAVLGRELVLRLEIFENVCLRSHCHCPIRVDQVATYLLHSAPRGLWNFQERLWNFHGPRNSSYAAASCALVRRHCLDAEDGEDLSEKRGKLSTFLHAHTPFNALCDARGHPTGQYLPPYKTGEGGDPGSRLVHVRRDRRLTQQGPIICRRLVDAQRNTSRNFKISDHPGWGEADVKPPGAPRAS